MCPRTTKAYRLAVSLLPVLILAACGGRAAAQDEIESEFLELARSDLASGGDTRTTHEFVAAKPPEVQLRLARAAAAGPEPALRRLGAALFVTLEHYGEAASVLAELLVAGEDLGGFGHALLSGGDEPGLRTFIALAGTLLAHRGGYSPQERRRADDFLCRIAGAERPCPDDAVEARVAELEELAEQLDEPPSP